MNQTKWTDEIFTRALALWKEGKSGAQTASVIRAEFGVVFTHNAVVGKMHRTGNARPADTRRVPRSRAGRAKPQPRPQTQAPRAAAPKPAPSLRLSILDLDRKQCRFGTHETPDGDHEFCGHPVSEGSSYCPAHRAVIVDHKRTDAARRKKKRRDDPGIAALRIAQLNAGLTRVFG